MEKEGVHPLRLVREQYNFTLEQLAVATKLSVKTLWKAEHGEPIGAESRRLICKYFRKTSQELGLVTSEKKSKKQGISSKSVAYQEEMPTLIEPLHTAISSLPNIITQDTPIIVRELGGQDMDALRRKLLQQILGVTSTALLPKSYNLLDTDALDRLVRTVKQPSSLDDTMLSNLEQINKSYWELFENTQSTARYDIVPSMLGHLQTVTRLLDYSLPSYKRERLCFLASETTQVLGEIFFDAKNNNVAERYYNVALTMAKEAHNDLLYSMVLGRKCFIPIYSDDADRAIPFVQEALHTLPQNAPDIARAWLYAVEAEAHANCNALQEATHALENSELFLDRVYPEKTVLPRTGEAAYGRFDYSILLGYKGVCSIRLRQSKMAQTAIQESLALLDKTRTRHKAITLVDLAATYAQQAEVDIACTHLTQALNLMTETRSPRGFQRVLDVRVELASWNKTQAVRTLDEYIHSLRN